MWSTSTARLYFSTVPALLFLCYIKGLPTTVSDANSKMSMYPDDTTSYYFIS